MHLLATEFKTENDCRVPPTHASMLTAVHRLNSKKKKIPQKYIQKWAKSTIGELV